SQCAGDLWSCSSAPGGPAARRAVGGQLTVRCPFDLQRVDDQVREIAIVPKRWKDIPELHLKIGERRSVLLASARPDDEVVEQLVKLACLSFSGAVLLEDRIERFRRRQNAQDQLLKGLELVNACLEFGKPRDQIVIGFHHRRAQSGGDYSRTRRPSPLISPDDSGSSRAHAASGCNRRIS